ncbi:EAL domain-containing protein [Nocardioides panacis]|uniref:EAL domain-containing protein n=1 Tax=Nocardioides panacis TaxID=2849501 RepID=A0A975T0K5_9ACTN|nr:EAL domain-containing protein [Nocardioides panacis]QWZ08679.1 EAL domain-containing protein [Nocardioides panacis]
MPTRRSGDDDERAHEIVAAADAATRAADDAHVVALSAADTTLAAQEAVSSASEVASTAKLATAATVAAAARAAAEVAAQAAVAVESDAISRALETAAQAVVALETIAAELSDDVDPDGANRAAAAVAATVAAEVIAQVKATADAAAKVAQAVAVAADEAAMAAATAAAIVDLAAGSAETSAHVVAGSSADTQAASGAVLVSTAHVADLAQRRLATLHQHPMVVELRDALAHNELLLHYQPMYDLATGAIVGVEALLRWQHPRRGLLTPVEFLDVAEGPHLVVPIGDWVIGTAIAQASRWHRALGSRAPVMWVNVSCNQLGQQHLAGLVEAQLTQVGLPASRLGIEVTERQLATRVDDVAGDLVALREVGVGLAVDDFGTGYASLDYLRRFTFDEIKIDGSFIAGLDQDPTDTAVTCSIVALGRALDLTVVAEGVETQAQHDRLRQLGCSVVQGYLFQRPAAAEVIDRVLRSQSVDA